MIWVALAFALGAPEVSRFAVIVGNNHSPEGLAELRYADDDAVLYAQQLGDFNTSTELLTTLDDATQRRFAGLARRTRPPTRAELWAALERSFRAIRGAGGAKTELTFVFVGHGSQDEDGHGFLHLQDGRLTRAELFDEIVAASPATLTHVIIDACHAYSLVAGRGEDAKERQDGFAEFLSTQELSRYPSVGVLLATSDSNQTHEWSRLEAGVFSYLVRAALLGGADVNGDRRLEYSEVAAFADAAGSELSRFGKALHTFAWAPRQDRSAPLLDLTIGRNRREVSLGSELVGHLLIESEDGIRVGELNKEPGSAVSLSLPTSQGFFLHNETHERWIAAGDDDVALDDALEAPLSTAHRGSLEVAFERGLFATSFGPAYYRGFVSGKPYFVPVTLVAPATDDPGRSVRIGVDVGYAAAPYPLVAERLEHGFFLRVLLAPDRRFFLSFGLEGAWSRLRGYEGEQAGRGALYAGAGVALELAQSLWLRGGLEAGIAPLFVQGSAPSYDVLVPALQTRLGLELGSTPRLRLGLDVGLGALLVTIDDHERLRYRPSLALRALWLL